MESQPENRIQNNPVFVIAVACLLALIMSSISFVLYYRSDTRKTVEQLQKNSLEKESQANSSAAPTEISVDYIDEVEEKAGDLIDTHNNETDFSAAELTDSALGL